MLCVGVAATPSRVLAAADVVVNPSSTVIELWGAAKEAAEEALKQGQLGQITDGLVGIFMLCVDRLDDFLERLSQGAQMRIAAAQLLTQVRIEVAQAELDARTTDTLSKAILRLFVKRTPPRHEYLCKSILALQNTAATESYEKEVSRMAAEAISNRYRCPTCSGMGPDYVGMEMKRSCKRRYGNPIDGVATDCKDTNDITGTDGRKLADANITSMDGGQIFEMPRMISKTYKDSVTGLTIVANMPSETNLTPRQEFWLAAWDNIFLVAGPRPSPRHGKAMKTPIGKTQRAMFNHCVASQNALVKQATDLLAFYTRPNCTDNKELCDAQQKKCMAVEKILKLDEFDNCEKGLSPSEVHEIAQRMCKSSQHYIDNGLAGQSQHKMAKTIALCEALDKSGKAYVKTKQDNYLAAIRGMQTLKPCWAAVEALGSGGGSAENDRETVREQNSAETLLPQQSFIRKAAVVDGATFSSRPARTESTWGNQ